jgi:NTP pyrophosphatase (non-canonical NTP hydrolase)
MTHVDLIEYQQQVRNGLMLKAGCDPLPHCALGLAGEAGEVADTVKKSQYDFGEHSLDRDRFLLELGDVLWYLTHLADQMGTTVHELALLNVQKLEARHPGVYSSERLLRTVPLRRLSSETLPLFEEG